MVGEFCLLHKMFAKCRVSENTYLVAFKKFEMSVYFKNFITKAVTEQAKSV